MKVSKQMGKAFLTYLLIFVFLVPLFTTGGFAASKATAKTTASAAKVKAGDTVTVTVSLDQTVTAKGFGIDFIGDSDSKAFELVEAKWSNSVKENSMMSPVDTEKGVAASAATKTFDVTGDIFSFKLRVKDKAVSGTYHLEASVKFTDANAAQTNLATKGTDVKVEGTDSKAENTDKKEEGTHSHVYASEYEKNATEHWKICTVSGCKVASSKEAHVYDHACDTACNACGYQRKTTHDYSVDGFDAEQHWKKCKACGAVDESSKASHVGGNDEEKFICTICKHPFGEQYVQPPVQEPIPENTTASVETIEPVDPENPENPADSPEISESVEISEETETKQNEKDDQDAKPSVLPLLVLLLVLAVPAVAILLKKYPGLFKRKEDPKK